MSTSPRRLAALAAATALASATLAACGEDNDGSGADADITSACSLDNPPVSEASPPPEGEVGRADGKVGAILPDTTSSTRYELYDAPLLTQTLTDAGIEADVQNAQGDKNRFTSIAQSMIGGGVDVLIIDSIDAASGAGVEAQAAEAGVDVIDYDRVNLGGTAPYYVSFDNEDVGRLQAQALVDCLEAQEIEKPRIIMMNGGTDVDNNAVLFQKGAHSVLDPLAESGDIEIVGEATVKGWKVENAAPAFQQALTAAGGDVQGVLAANDDIANAVVGVLKEPGLDGHVVLTGQDASVEGLQNVITGQQSMTIFKDVRLEATAASQLAIALIQGTDPADAGITLEPFEDPEAPDHELEALLLPPQVITQANVQDILDAGALELDELCAGIEDDCEELGLS